jgi:hypothetical protein
VWSKSVFFFANNKVPWVSENKKAKEILARRWSDGNSEDMQWNLDE